MSDESVDQGAISPPHSQHDNFDPEAVKIDRFPTPFTPPTTVRPSPLSNPALSAYNSSSQYPPLPQRSFHTVPPNFGRRLQYHTPPLEIEPGIMTRSGRTLGSPMELAYHERRSQTPKARKNRNKPGKKAVPALNLPLSVLTKDYKMPVRDMGAWVNRPIEDRQKEVESKKGHVSRPMNSFMLYRSAYAERVKQFCKENNHQVVSQVTGQSWPLEPPEIRKAYEDYAIQERDNHAAAHPGYKFAPNKGNKKRTRGEDDSESDGDWGGSRSAKYSRTGRRDDTRSMSSTPFEPDRSSMMYAPIYTVQQHPHPSSYQANNPLGPPPFVFGPDGLAGGHYHPQAIPYGQNIDDVRFGRTQDGLDMHGQPGQLIGMPDGVGDDLLGGLGGTGFGPPIDSLIDPQLNQLDPNYIYDQYGSMPEQSYQVQAQSHGYANYEPASDTYHSGDISHPGMATLTDEWSYGPQAGVDFDNELQQWN